MDMTIHLLNFAEEPSKTRLQPRCRSMETKMQTFQSGDAGVPDAVSGKRVAFRGGEGTRAPNAAGHRTGDTA